MPNLNQLSTQSFQTNLLLNNLNKDDKSKTVYDFSGGYNLIDFLATRNAPARRVHGVNGVFQKPLLGNNAVVAQVQSNTLVGTNMRVTFTDPSYNVFRNQVTVSDGTAANNQGRVIQHGPGYIVIEPVNVTFATATHFVPGTFATALFNASGNFGSTGMESLYEYPTYVQNQTSITRESVDYFRRDMAQTWVEYEGDFWYSSQDVLGARRFANQLEYKALFSTYQTLTNSAIGGTVNYSMGLRDAIRDPQRGGIYQPLSSAMTQADFESWIGRMADRQALRHTNFTIMCGRGFLKMIQNFTQPYIQYSGDKNTFGGVKVKGIDVMTYSVNGITVDFIMHPLFNNREMWPQFSSVSSLGAFTRMQYTAVALDLGMIDSVGGASQPAIEKCYFGEQEVNYDYLSGVAMSGSVPSSAPSASSARNLQAVNDRDGISLQIYSDCAYDFMPYRMGWLELVV
jgi:hypothetical protein